MPTRLRFGRALILGIALCTPLSPTPSQANGSQIPRMTRGISYKVARIYLLKTGAKPTPSVRHDPDRCNGAPGVCERYPEVNGCAGTAFNPCNMLWITRTGVPFTVQISGDALRPLRDGMRPLTVDGVRPRFPDED